MRRLLSSTIAGQHPDSALGHETGMAATERRSSVDRRASAVGPPISTALLFRVEVPATGFSETVRLRGVPGVGGQVEWLSTWYHGQTHLVVS